MQELKLTKELTPKVYACAIGACPAIYKTNKDSYVLVGKLVDANKLGIAEKVGEGEVTVEIPRGLVADMDK